MAASAKQMGPQGRPVGQNEGSALCVFSHTCSLKSPNKPPAGNAAALHQPFNGQQHAPVTNLHITAAALPQTQAALQGHQAQNHSTHPQVGNGVD